MAELKLTTGRKRRVLGGAFLGAVVAFGMIAPAQAATDWSPQPAGTTTKLNDVAFANPTTGIAVGLGGTILSTSDGGAHWVARKSGITSDLRTVVYGGDACGLGQASTPCYWAGGDDGNILWTNDGGVTWCPQKTDVTERINGLAAAGPNDIFAVGTKGTILRSGDGGTNARNCGAAGVYEKQASGTTKDLFNVGNDPAGDTVAGLAMLVRSAQTPEAWLTQGLPPVVVTRAVPWSPTIQPWTSSSKKTSWRSWVVPDAWATKGPPSVLRRIVPPEPTIQSW